MESRRKNRSCPPIALPLKKCQVPPRYLYDGSRRNFVSSNQGFGGLGGVGLPNLAASIGTLG